MRSNILVIGDKDSVSGFKMIGLEVLIFEDEENTVTMLKQLIEDGIEIIFFTEEVQESIQNIREMYASKIYPMFVVIPSLKKESTDGKKYIQDLVVSALGSSSIGN